MISYLESCQFRKRPDELTDESTDERTNKRTKCARLTELNRVKNHQKECKDCLDLSRSEKECGIETVVALMLAQYDRREESNP